MRVDIYLIHYWVILTGNVLLTVEGLFISATPGPTVSGLPVSKPTVSFLVGDPMIVGIVGKDAGLVNNRGDPFGETVTVILIPGYWDGLEITLTTMLILNFLDFNNNIRKLLPYVLGCLQRHG